MSDCLFCKIIAGDIPSQKVYEDDTVFAFRDIQPQAPTHILVVPKTHVTSAATVTDPKLFGDVMVKAASIARSEGLEDAGYRLVSNHGEHGGQSVFHLHVHILGGRQMQWPPG